MTEKHEQCTRIISVQFNTFPSNNTEEDRAKRLLLESLLRTTDADIMVSQEDNTSWDLVPSERRPKDRCRQWFESLNVHSAFNTHHKNTERKAHLQGGVSVWSINDASHRVLERGVDTTGLGRWCYVRYQGRGGITTRVYSIYRPCKSEGPNTVYAQHTRYMAEKEDARCPQVAMVEDLKRQLQEAHDTGDQLIVGGDFNLDMRSNVWKQIMEEFTLENAIFHRHGEEGPNTYKRGSTQIDGFLVSRTLKITASGYLPFSRSVGDHRTIWFDTSYHSIYGNLSPRILSKESRRLQLYDPRVVHRYLVKLKQLIKDEDLYKSVEQMYSSLKENPQHGLDTDRFEYIITKLVGFMREAEQKCRQFKAGEVDFSPMIQKAREAVGYWNMRVKQCHGKRICKNTMKHKKKLMDPAFIEDEEISLQKARKIQKAARRNLRKANKKAVEARTTWQEGLLLAKAAEEDTTIASQLRKRINEEEQRRINRAIKSAVPPKMSKSISVIERPDDWDDDECPVQRFTEQEKVEECALEYLNHHFRQCWDTPGGSETFRQEFGMMAELPATERVLDGSYQPPPGMDPYMIDLLKALKKPDGVEDLPAEFSTLHNS